MVQRSKRLLDALLSFGTDGFFRHPARPAKREPRSFHAAIYSVPGDVFIFFKLSLRQRLHTRRWGLDAVLDSKARRCTWLGIPPIASTSQWSSAQTAPMYRHNPRSISSVISGCRSHIAHIKWTATHSSFFSIHLSLPRLYLPSYPTPYPRRRLLGASPHSVAIRCHAFYFHALYSEATLASAPTAYRRSTKISAS